MERGDLKEYRRVRREGGNNLIHSSFIAPDGALVTYFEDVTSETELRGESRLTEGKPDL